MNSDRLLSSGPAGILVRGLARYWWAMALRGVVAVIFGVLAFAWPGITLVSLVLLYGVYALFDGVFSLAAAIAGEAPEPRWWLAVVGILGIFAGVITFVEPGDVGLYLVLFIGAWAILIGIFEIIGAIKLRKVIDSEWMLILHGILTVLFGAFIMYEPGLSAVALVWVLGAYAVVGGVMLIVFAFRLKGYAR